MKQELPSPNERISTKAVIWFMVLTGAVMAYIAFTTTPTQAGPTGVTLFFLLIFLMALAITELLYRGLVKKRHHWAYWLKVVYALVPVFILALSSLRQLNTLDIIMGGVLITIVSIYHNRYY